MQQHCAWIHAEQAKGKKAIVVPINNDALAVFQQQNGKHSTHVFRYEGNPFIRANNHAWVKALIRAEIAGFR